MKRRSYTVFDGFEGAKNSTTSVFIFLIWRYTSIEISMYLDISVIRSMRVDFGNRSVVEI